MTNSKRTAVLFDPHPLWLTGLRQVMERIDVDVRAATSDRERALSALEEHLPALFVTELVGDASEAANWLGEARSRVPGLRVVVLSGQQDPRYVDGSLAGGAAAHVIKTAHPDDLASAIRQAFELSIYYAGATEVRETTSPASDNAESLTRRELEILRLVSDGRSNAQVARDLWVTEQTVKFHLSNIYRKIGVANRTEASRWAQRRGLLAERA